MIARGPWWCPTCSRAHAATTDTNLGLPCCPKCGTALEQQGQHDGDDALGYEDDPALEAPVDAT